MGNCQTCVGVHKPSPRTITEKIKKMLKNKRKKKKNPQQVHKNTKSSFKDFHVLKNHPKWTHVGDKYDLGEEIGRGEFGIAYLAVDKQTKRKFACKSILKSKFRSYADVEDVRREVDIMSNLLPDHPNIVKLQDTFEDRDAVHLVMELCEGGELFDRILARGHYTELEAAKILKTIIEVVRTCHKNGFIHRDLKPENFLFATKNENSILKSIDFGLSVAFQPGERFNEVVGSPYYMAPELLRGDYGKEIDLWSVGVILYILLCGVPPFWDQTNKGVANKILHGTLDFNIKPWPKVSNAAKDLVCRLLEHDPTKRLTAEQVLEHPWLQKATKHQNVPLVNVVRGRQKHFASMNQLKKKALRVIAECLSMEEVKVAKKVFQMMDSNNDDKVTYDELKVGLQTIGFRLTESEMQMMMEAADVDGHGELRYKEFVAITIHLQIMENEDYFHRAFMFFDKNDSGYIEIDELNEAISEGSSEKTNWQVLDDILKEVDTDKDGRISYSEFMAMMKIDIDWRKASRPYSRKRSKSMVVSSKHMNGGSVNLDIKLMA